MICWDEDGFFNLNKSSIERFKTDDVTLLTFLNAVCGNPLGHGERQKFYLYTGDRVGILENLAYEIKAIYRSNGHVYYVTEGSKCFRAIESAFEIATLIKLIDFSISRTLDDGIYFKETVTIDLKFQLHTYHVTLRIPKPSKTSFEPNIGPYSLVSIFEVFPKLYGLITQKQNALIPVLEKPVLAKGLLKFLKLIGIEDELKAQIAAWHLEGLL